MREAVEDWLEYGLGILCTKHIIPLRGARKLRDLTACEVEAWLGKPVQVAQHGYTSSSARLPQPGRFGEQRLATGSCAMWSSLPTSPWTGMAALQIP